MPQSPLAKSRSYKQNDEAIILKGARAHNLKNVSIELPRDKLIVFTGPSGSGKSSLAFDTIYAEGQRRYVESLSVYARQFLEQVAKPEVESISGLSPTISIDQKTISYNPRSTVGTVTEIYDYLRVLYARVAKPYCYNCNKPIQSQTLQQIADTITGLPLNAKVSILAPVIKGRKGEYQKELFEFRQKGFSRVRIDGTVYDLSDEIKLDKNKKHDIEIYVDRLLIKGDPKELASRVGESVELALKLGSGNLILHTLIDGKDEEVLCSEKFACVDCGISYPEPEPRTFSFNSPRGACSECDGLGVIRSLEDSEEVDEGESESGDVPEYASESPPCPSCRGLRLKRESLHYRLGSVGIGELTLLSISDELDFLKSLSLSKREQIVAGRLLREIAERLHFLCEVGVGYLNLARSAASLSGGEAQRIRLATQIGSSLVGVTYVLDEPSIGLHPRDNHRLLGTLSKLKDMGNTVLVVEHDQDTMEIADFIVDVGPGAGKLGGAIVAAGTLDEIKSHPQSITGKYLRHELAIPIPKKRRSPSEKAGYLRVHKAEKNNLKKTDLEIPLGLFTCVTGVSGSGKSTLILDTLYPLVLNSIYGVQVGDLQISGSSGLENLDKVIDIDQSPIGRTPRSNPATYTGVFSFIRDLYSQLPESKARGYTPGRFSFNVKGVKGGRCEACEGDGLKRIVMHFLPDVYVQCEVCQGRRYNRDTLSVKFKGKSIADVLEMPISDALPFFDSVPWIKQRLTILNDVGLGYVTLGQSATTLSGGEAQRIKLARELARRSTGKTLYILDEPSTGLHFDDVRKLVEILQRLVDQGNTVVVIEHNLDIIKTADHLIDMGPEGGSGGGRVIASGTPEQICRVKSSFTGQYLKPYLK